MYRTIAFAFMAMLFCDMKAQKASITSTLEVYDLTSGKRDTVLHENVHFEAPNWSLDGNYLIINEKGRLFKVGLKNGVKTALETGPLQNCNNDHGISFDGQWLAVSNNDIIEGETETSRIYVLPVEGSKNPTLVTQKHPSYWHGWSPDGRFLLYVAKRNGDYDIYRISVDGGEEERLTTEKGLDDGPEYSPDGRHIYYNSMASGKMELWQMNADGTNKTQLTKDAYSNWFPHPSPDGEQLVYISYLVDQGDRHPPMKRVALRLYHLNSKTTETLFEFTGGQGTINVPSWSPDGKKFAFVSYQEN
jgi:Tol biopolymer transport system component